MSNSRIIIDTNVIVSALIFSNSTTMEAFNLAYTKGKILMSVALISELIDVLNRKKFDRYVSRETRRDFLGSLSTETELIEITEMISICRDEKDNKFLELAISGNASYIVTGDKDLLELHPFRDVLILTPTDFINHFTSHNFND